MQTVVMTVAVLDVSTKGNVQVLRKVTLTKRVNREIYSQMQNALRS